MFNIQRSPLLNENSSLSIERFFFFSFKLLNVSRYTQNNSNGKTGEKKTASTHAHQWERNTGNRKQIHAHCHVCYCLYHQCKAESQCQECAEGKRTSAEN